MKNNLLARLEKVMVNSIPFMDGREKGDQILNEELTIVDFGYLTSEDGEFIVYLTKEHDELFFFGGSVLTEKFKQIEENFTEDEVKELLEMGVKVKLIEKKSKNKRKYVDVELITE